MIGTSAVKCCFHSRSNSSCAIIIYLICIAFNTCPTLPVRCLISHCIRSVLLALVVRVVLVVIFLLLLVLVPRLLLVLVSRLSSLLRRRSIVFSWSVARRSSFLRFSGLRLSVARRRRRRGPGLVSVTRSGELFSIFSGLSCTRNEQPPC